MRKRNSSLKEIHAQVNAWRAAVGKSPLHDPRDPLSSRPERPYYREARRWADVGRVVLESAEREEAKNELVAMRVPFRRRDLEVIETIAQASGMTRPAYLQLMIKMAIRQRGELFDTKSAR